MSTTKNCPFSAENWILFQGDSITDCGRREIVNRQTNKLGNGYVQIVAKELARRWPEQKLEVLNRAVSGDRTTELLQRWERDCLGLQAEWLSVMVGVNDVWRARTQWMGQQEVPLREFVTNYKILLDKASAAGVKHFVLMSPTTIDFDLDSDLNKTLGDYADAIKILATEYKGIYVPAREAMRAAIATHPDTAYTTDGCHPTLAGHEVLARVWLETVCGK